MAAAPASASAAETEAAAFDAAHARLLADQSIQFSLQPFKVDPPPAWLRWLIDFISDNATVLRFGFWVVVGGLALFLLYKLARRLAGEKWPWGRRERQEQADEWRPEEAPARALLAEADRLAAEARYDEAAHLLLFRSIEEIAARRPQLVRPALTSRDIAGAPGIPNSPRSAFNTIVHLVERSLFGGRGLAQDDWQRCRAAYEDFALAGAWRR